MATGIDQICSRTFVLMEACPTNKAATCAERKSWFREGFSLSVWSGRTSIFKVKNQSLPRSFQIIWRLNMSSPTSLAVHTGVCYITCCQRKTFPDNKKSQIPCKSTSPEICTQLAAAKLLKCLLSTAITTARRVGFIVTFRKGLRQA